MRAVILCGGRGTRAWPHTDEVPKPLLPVGDRPVVAHVLEVLAAQGLTRFTLAAGYRAADLAAFARTLPADWEVEVTDTGLDTGTGGRVRRSAPTTPERLLVTYADGLADIDLSALVADHERGGCLATITCVPLPSQFGTLDLDDEGKVVRFLEKPRLQDHLINAGFMVFEPGVLDVWPEPGDDLEREVLPHLAGLGQLATHRHHGFWQSLDTWKDALELTALCEGGAAPPWHRAG